MLSRFLPLVLLATVAVVGYGLSPQATTKKKILFFTKSSGFEHSVISWKNGQPSHAERVLTDLGNKEGWEFTFSKDGSKFSKDYLADFDAVFFYTSGNLLTEGTDKQPPMTEAGKQALFEYVKSGKGFIGTHSASDTFHTDNESQKGPERFANHGEKADAYVRFLGAEFIKHGAQQMAKNTITDNKFPGFDGLGAEYSMHEEWYSLKDFRDDIHVLSVIDAPAMKGSDYERPPFPTTWARKEGEGRVWYTAMGHREDVWMNPTFQKILTGGISWSLGTAKAELKPNLKEVAPEAMTNPKYVPPAPKKEKPAQPERKAA